MKKIFTAFTLLALLVIPILTGCGTSDDPVLAEVGDYKIKASEFNSYFNRSRLTFPSAEVELEERKKLLDTMINTRLLIQGAYEKNIDKLDEIDRIILANKEKFLLDALYKKNIADKAEVTEAEIKDYYNKLDTKVRASHILVSDADTAQMIFEKIQNGENFEQLVMDYSLDPQAKRNKGDLGYFVWGSVVEEFEKVTFAMEPGELSPPFKSRYGYHIVKVVDKLPNENRTSYENMYETIKNQITQRKTLNLTEAYVNSLKEKYTITVDTSTIAYLFHKREQMYPPQVLASLPRSDFDMEQLDRDEKELVLATVTNGGHMTLNEYLTQLQNIPLQYRPDLDDYDSVAAFVFEMKKVDLMSLEAVNSGLDNDEDYLAQIKLFKELNMADIMRNDSIVSPIPPDEGIARQYYDEHPDEFTNPAQIHVYEILLSDELKARQLVKEINSLAEFKDRAMELTERSGKRSKSGDMGYITRQWFPEIFDLAKKTAVGEIAGPVVTQAKYSIFYVVDKIEPELKDYLGQKRGILDKMRTEQKGQAIDKWLEQRREVTSVEINEDNLEATVDKTKYAETDSVG